MLITMLIGIRVSQSLSLSLLSLSFVLSLLSEFGLAAHQDWCRRSTAAGPDTPRTLNIQGVQTCKHADIQTYERTYTRRNIQTPHSRGGPLPHPWCPTWQFPDRPNPWPQKLYNCCPVTKQWEPWFWMCSSNAFKFRCQWLGACLLLGFLQSESFRIDYQDLWDSTSSFLRICQTPNEDFQNLDQEARPDVLKTVRRRSLRRRLLFVYSNMK